jgi:hypothetical protein
VINAFDACYFMPADEVMANIRHVAQNMNEDAGAPSMTAPNTSPPPISPFVVAGRGSHSGRGHNPRGPRGGRGLPNNCSACGSLDHIMSSCTAPYDSLLKWTLAKRKMIVQKYGTPGGSASAHGALRSEPTDESDNLPALEDCTDEYDDTEVSVPFSYVAFSSSITTGRYLSHYWVIDSACSIKFTAFRSDFSTFTPSSTRSRVGGVGVDVKGSGSVRMSIRLACGHVIQRTIHALYTPDLSSRSTQRIGRLLSVSWLQSHYRCEFVFSTDSDNGLLVVPTRRGVLEPSGNGLYLLPHRPKLPPRPSAEKARDPCSRVALTA